MQSPNDYRSEVTRYMKISETKKKIVIDNYFESDCNLDTSIRKAYEKGFDRGIEKATESHKYPIITLCGSTKFKDDFIRVQKELTLKGYIVISVGLFGHSGDDEVWKENTKEMLDDMHKHKIDMADSIYVINKDGYIGDSTKSEIEYAKKHNKEIKYMESI